MDPEAITFRKVCMSKRKNLDPWGQCARFLAACWAVKHLFCVPPISYSHASQYKSVMLPEAELIGDVLVIFTSCPSSGPFTLSDCDHD